MTPVGPSLTAKAVAEYRLGFERLRAPFGDPAADDRLAQDVAGAWRAEPHELMARYLRGRTLFFDRVVVSGLEQGARQVVSVGAGYDGRSLRYAKPGVRWFELDDPHTQSDKRERLGRLKIPTSHVAFESVDLEQRGGVDAALRRIGFEPRVPTLILCEGVMVYLEATAFEALLADLRANVTAGSRLALSLPPPSSEAQAERREGFRSALAAVGEPAHNSLKFGQAVKLLEAARWRTAETSERASRAGFVVALPA